MNKYPYADKLSRLVTSVISAQQICLANLESNEVRNNSINKCFEWLIKETPLGIDRHLMMDGKNSLRAKNRRNNDGVTRISELIVSSIQKQSNDEIVVSSPLKVVLDYLTDPSALSTHAYALVACRSYLFEIMRCVPNLTTEKKDSAFDVKDIRDQWSSVFTSVKSRPDSKGQDKVEVTKTPTTQVFRHFLALRGYFNFRFRSIYAFNEYQISGESLKSDFFEFSRHENLAALPDVGELVNEIFGLPLPLEGADTIFRGGLKFSSSQGLIVCVQGGAGSGKTTLALAAAAALSPLGIKTFYFTAEEREQDLVGRLQQLVPEEVRKLSLFPKLLDQYIFPARVSENPLDELDAHLVVIKQKLSEEQQSITTFGIPKPCRVVVVLDGLRDLFSRSRVDAKVALERFYKLIGELRNIQALIILTTGADWIGDSELNYVVDVAIKIDLASADEYGVKPERRFLLSKARHQLCAIGTHSLHMDSASGVRFSPQISYRIEQRSVWKATPCDQSAHKQALRMAHRQNSKRVFSSSDSVDIYKNSHIIISGLGSGGKAGFALKLALAPTFSKSENVEIRERVLIISFLYQEDYYIKLRQDVENRLATEYDGYSSNISRVEVLSLYPGDLKPHDLFNRIDRKIRSAELRGDPYSCVLIDGIHNVFLQFPAIEKYPLFWSQLYNYLRTFELSVILTHTTLALPFALDGHERLTNVDDLRSVPLRQSLVARSDFHIEIDPAFGHPIIRHLNRENIFWEEAHLHVVKVVSAIGQRVPPGFLMWDRQSLTLHESRYIPRQLSLPL